MKKKTVAVVLLLCVCILLVPKTAQAASYPSVTISGIPTFGQRLSYTIPLGINPLGISVDVSVGGLYADCGIDCVAMIEGFYKGYPSEDDRVYHAVMAARNPNVKWETTTVDPGDQTTVQPFPISGYTHTYSMTAEDIYGQLRAGNPVMVHRKYTTGGYEHWVVVYGYNGPSDSLNWKKFMIMSPTSAKTRVDYLNLSDLVSSFDQLNVFMYRTSGLSNLPYYKSTVTLDVNGWVDGREVDNLKGIGTFDYKVTPKGEKTKTVTGVNDYYHSSLPTGSTYYFYNIKGINGYDYVGLKSGSATTEGTVTGDTKVILEFKKRPETVVLDVNGWVNGKEVTDLKGIATFDSEVLIKGKTNPEYEHGISDYYHSTLPYGSTYKFYNIKGVNGYEYVGVRSGSAKAEGTATGDTKVVLEFIKPTFTFEVGQTKYEVGETWAQLGIFKIYSNIDLSRIKTVGCELGDADGMVLAGKEEDAYVYQDHLSHYYHVSGDADEQDIRYRLTPGTKYKLRMYVVFNGKRYYSDWQTFTTKSSATPKPTPTATPKPTPTPTPKATSTATPKATPTPTPKVTPTATPKVTLTPTATPKATPTPTPKATPTATPKVTPTPTPKVTPTPTPYVTSAPTPKVTATPTPKVTPTAVPLVRVRFDFDDSVGSEVAVYDRKADPDAERKDALHTVYTSKEEVLLTPGTYWYAAWFNDDDWPDIVEVQDSFAVKAVPSEEQPLVIRIDTPARPDDPIDPARAYVTIVNVRNKLSVRKDASSDTKRLGYAYNGEVYPLLAVKGEWYRIQYKPNVVGYVYGGYVIATNEQLVPHVKNDLAKTPEPTEKPAPSKTAEPAGTQEPPAATEPPEPTDEPTSEPEPAAVTGFVEGTEAPMLYPVAPNAAEDTPAPSPEGTSAADGSRMSVRLGVALICVGAALVVTQVGIIVLLLRRRQRGSR